MIFSFFQNNYLFLYIFAYFSCFLLYLFGCLLFCFFKNNSFKLLNYINYISLGILLSTIFFSIFIPSLEFGYSNFIFTFSFGVLFILFINIIINTVFHNQSGKSISVCFSYFIHNIPEGILVGSPLGLLSSNSDVHSVSLLLSLAICIAIQNFPEGISLGFVLKKNIKKTKLIILLCIICGISEPIFCLLSSYYTSTFNNSLSFMFPFSCGIMLYTFIQQLISSCEPNDNVDLVTFFILIGFIIMSLFEIFLS